MISLAILASVAFAADKTVFDICNDKTCYTQILKNVKKQIILETNLFAFISLIKRFLTLLDEN